MSDHEENIQVPPEDTTPKEDTCPEEAPKVKNDPLEKFRLKVRRNLNEVKYSFLDKLGEVLSKGKVTINLILYTLMGIIITPFISAMQIYIKSGSADFTSFIDVLKYVAAPFVMLVATKRIMDDLISKEETTKVELDRCRKSISEFEQKMNNTDQCHLLDLANTRSKYELEIQQMKGIIDIKDYEIDRINSELKIYKK